MDLRRLDENVYEIPAQGEMRVPARVYASEPLLEGMREEGRTLTQVRNAATLPGIRKHSLVLPDGHLGYGFPIGGVAATDFEDGVISPGAIGFDINCLSGDTPVLLGFGRRRSIRSLTDRVGDERAVTVADDGPVESEIRLATEDRATVYEVETATGDRIEATADHPFLTPDGMVELGDLGAGDTVYTYPFEGIEDADPPEFVVLGEDDFAEETRRLVSALRERDLLPLRSTDEAFARLLALVGYHTGHGSFDADGVVFYGGREGVERISETLHALGFDAAVYAREHEPGGENGDGDRDEDGDGNGVGSEHDSRGARAGHCVRVGSRALAELLLRLGAPEGPRVESAATVPDSLDRLADWQRALYLSAFFGAAMSAPAAGARGGLCRLSVSHGRIREHEAAGRTFMHELMEQLDDLGVRTDGLETVERGGTGARETVRFRVDLTPDPGNLCRFLTRIGYRYSPEKRREALLAAAYLKRENRRTGHGSRSTDRGRTVADGGAAPAAAGDRADAANRRPSRPVAAFEAFRESTDQLASGAVATRIVSITERGEKPVYDIGVTHEAHNFVAGGLVVSNCGVRLLRTDLNYDDVRGREEEVVERLYEAVPAGLGKGGYIDVSRDDLRGILAEGIEWMASRGHARPADVERCEEGGRLPGDPDAVPTDGIDRGLSQVGSLGSGNHFLEVQRVSDVYDPTVADAYGLREDGVVVMIHSGSRGLGHQTCQEYLREFETEYPDVVEALPDRQLAYAPIHDELAVRYREAMYAAANFAWANRQAMTQAVREVLGALFGADAELVYDVCHNVAKEERHAVEDGEERDVLVHRKGATRAFPPGHPEVPAVYRSVGQPVLIPGSMGTHSYVLAGGERSMDLTFGSTAHGAGRLKSRTQAKQDHSAGSLQQSLRGEGVYVRARSNETVAEEAPAAYKNVDEVVRVSDALGIGTQVARMRPVANIKG